MILAIPDWQGRVSPVFDVAEQVLLIDLDREDHGRRWEGHGRRRMESLKTTAPHERAQRLAELGIDVLVCGAISWPLEALLTANGIRVIPLICGEVGEVVRAFCDGALEKERFAMPGCRRKKRHARNRCRRGGDGSIIEETP
ncbi:MAG: hypothetical protein GYA33_06450 [Thermogutta sp.]|nr:hypothetical protein [Thermogutta sp.]